MEFWKQLACFNINPNLYEISNHGNIRYRANHELVKQYVGINNGYCYISLFTINGNQYHYLVHRLVAASFILFRHVEQTQVNHIDSNKLNNNISNLEWSTPKENTRHAMEYGNFKFCEDRYNSKFTNDEVHSICRMLQEGVDYKNILTNINKEITPNNLDSIGNIKRRITYTSISKDYDFSKYEYNFSTYTNEQIVQICDYIKQGLDYRQIANLIGRDISTRRQRKTFSEFIRKIRNKETFKHITHNYDW